MINNAYLRAEHGRLQMIEGRLELEQIIKELRRRFQNEHDLDRWLEQNKLPKINDALHGRRK